MSYILDALKKSSEERRRRQEEDEQRPLPLSSPIKQEAPRRYRWLMILLLVTVLVFSAVGLWILSITGKSDSNVPQPETTLRSEPQQSLEIKPAGLPKSVSPETVAPLTSEQTVVAPERKDNAAGKSLEKPFNLNPDPKLPLMEELPLAIQAQLPEMKFSGHVFSPTPDLRMIMINTSVVREGDLIDADLRLMEITKDGLTMSHKGTDFKVVLF